MKNAFLFFVFTIVSIITFCQTQAPNADFEEWETLTNGAENPVGWGGSNFAVSFGLPQTIFRTTDAVSGEFAIRITTPSNLPGQVELNEAAFDDGGLPYTDRPLAMEAWIKGAISLGDTAFIQAKLTKWDTDKQQSVLVGEAYLELTAIDSTYQLRVDSFRYLMITQPDTLFLVAGFGDHDAVVANPDNEFYVDNIVFKGLSTSTVEYNKLKEIRVFPNPSAGKIYLNNHFNQATDFTLTVFNSIGEEVLQFSEKQVFEEQRLIDLSNHPEGMYFFRLTIEETIMTHKVLVLR